MGLVALLWLVWQSTMPSRRRGAVKATTGFLRRIVLAAAATAVVLPLMPATAEARPRNPGDREISAAQRDRAGKATEVGRLSGLLARANGDLGRASDRAELAVERYNKAVVDLTSATDRSTTARVQVVAARRETEAARLDFSRFARNSYMQGSTVGSVTALLDVRSPTDLLQRADLLGYVARRRLDGLGDLTRASVRRANAESAARAAVLLQQDAKAKAEKAKADAGRVVAAARAEAADLGQKRGELQRQLRAARVRLDGLLGERQRYDAWRKAQEAAAARERERQRRIRAEAAARRAAINRSAPPTERSAPPRAVDRGTRRSVERSSPLPTGGDGWSAAKGGRAVDAALSWIGTRYSWGGGNASGPTFGIDFPGGGAGANDSEVRGFDCSGLTLYAWAQAGISLPHYSGYQLRSGRRISQGELMPGDLVFWAYDTSDPTTIHHVAMYLGGGRVVMAPQSGDIVRIAPMWYEGYLGASRPGA